MAKKKSRPFLDITAGEQVVVRVDNPEPRERENNYGSMRYYYDVTHEGVEKTISATAKLHELISGLDPQEGEILYVSREGSGTATRWDVGYSKDNPAAVAARPSPSGRASRATTSPPPASAVQRTYQDIRDEFLAVLSDVHAQLRELISPEYADDHAQAAAATIYIACNRDGVSLRPDREQPQAQEEERPAQTSAAERLAKARQWARAQFHKAGAHPTQQDAVLQIYLGDKDASFHTLTAAQATRIATDTDNGKNLEAIVAAIAAFSEQHDEFPDDADMPF